jgi:HTH-type transcriptional regulator/antitoxin HipB
MDYLASTPKQLGQILKRCRGERRLTQREAGSRVGLKQSTVSAIEADATRARVASLYKLLSSLDLELVLREKTSEQPIPPGRQLW